MVATESTKHSTEKRSLHEKDSSKPQNETSEEPSSLSASDDGEYPTRMRLMFIVVALILAIFLTSLDFVGWNDF